MDASYLAQHGNVIDKVVFRLWSHKAIAETRFADADLAFVLLCAGHADDRHIKLFHGGDWAELQKLNKAH